MIDQEAEHDDHGEYYYFTGKQRLDTAMHTLHGLVQGLSADAKVCDVEVKHLMQWVSRYREFADRHPFNEVIPTIQRILSDGVVDEEERADLLWLCKKYTTAELFYDDITCDMQRLHGYLAGIIADAVINEAELKSLGEWIDDHAHLRRCWPYDELESNILHVLKDGKIDDQENEALMQFFGEFAPTRERRAVGVLDRGYSVNGVCAMTPEIVFTDRMFCFTGSSERGPREELARIVAGLGGKFHPRLTNDSHYLVVGADGNPCWAYACYGRKVEDAVERRRNGQKLQIVHEYDFWDAVEDAK